MAQPPGKHWEAVAYDESVDELAVFGGVEFVNNKMMLTDSLWLYNGKWRFIDGNIISGRWAHGQAYHNNVLYVYGGLRFNENQQEIALNDLYRFEGTWEKVTEGPKLYMPTLISMNGQLLLAGLQFNDKNKFEVWELETNKLILRSSTNLNIEGDGIKIFVAEDDFVVSYNNSSGIVLSNINQGETTQLNELPKRTKYGLTYNSYLDNYFLFGGLDETNNPTNDLWQIKNGLVKKFVSRTGPSPKSSSSLLPTTKGFILYGGTESGGRLSTEIWRYENESWINTEK
jgi:hypothetical protein